MKSVIFSMLFVMVTFFALKMWVDSQFETFILKQEDWECTKVEGKVEMTMMGKIMLYSQVDECLKYERKKNETSSIK